MGALHRAPIGARLDACVCATQDFEASAAGAIGGEIGGMP